MGRARYGVRDEVKEAADAFYRALSARNLKAIDVMWAQRPYTAVAGVSGDLAQGSEQVRRFWERQVAVNAGTKLDIRLIGMVCQVVGDVAWLSGTERRTLTQDGQVDVENLRVTCVMERAGTTWQLVSYHASLPAEEEPPLANVS
jgi:ketosteroid isomerase-like protein